jgi:hypothetical protein
MDLVNLFRAMRRNCAFLMLSLGHDYTKGHGNAISSVDLGFFVRSRKITQTLLRTCLCNFFFLVPMTTVRVSQFSIHGVRWHQRDAA